MNQQELYKAILKINKKYYREMVEVETKYLQAKQAELNKLLSDHYEIYQEAKDEWKEELQPGSIINYLAYQQFYRNSKLPPEINLLIEDQIIAEFSERQTNFYQVIKRQEIFIYETQVELNIYERKLKAIKEEEIQELLSRKPLPSSAKILAPQLSAGEVNTNISQPQLEAKVVCQSLVKSNPWANLLAFWRK